MPLILSGSVDISGSMTATTIIVSAPGGGGMVSSSQQIQNYNLFAVTSSANTFYGNLTVDKSSPNISVNAPTGTTGQYNINNGVGTLMWAMYSTTGGGNSQGNWGLYSAGRTGGAGSVIDIIPTGTTTFSTNLGTAASFNSGRIGGGGISIASGSVDRLYLGSANWMGVSGEGTGTTSIALASAQNSDIIFVTNATSTINERVRITNGGYLRLAGAGIQFNGDTADANSLDDYEEGTWTPVIGGLTSQSGQSYSGQTGNYTKIGRLVTATFRVVLTNKGTITGDVAIKGLPFTVQNSISFGSGVTYWVNLSTAWNYIYLAPVANDTSALVEGIKTAASSTIRAATADIANDSQFNGTITYFV